MMVTKAVILAGGIGSRMEPITKVIAKEMLPIVDRPVLSYLLEELKICGIKEILIVSHKSKEIIPNFFDNNGLKISYVYPNEPRGVVDALRHAKTFVGKDDFVLLFGDVMFHKSEKSIQKMIDIHNKIGLSVVTVMKIEKDKRFLYGIVEQKKFGPYSYIYNIIEKPKPNITKSLIAISGQYLLTSEIFRIMDSMGENKLFTDALLDLAVNNKLIMSEISQNYFDVGSKSGFIKANIFYALRHQETQKDIKKYIKFLCKKG